MLQNVQKRFYVSTVVKFANLRKNTKNMNKNALKDFKDHKHAKFETKCCMGNIYLQNGYQNHCATSFRAEKESTYGFHAFVACKVCKNANGQPASGQHPTNDAMRQFFATVDEDPEWFPGKHSDAPRGPKRVLCGANLSAIVSAAKRLKAEGEEPTYAAVVAACPGATLNPHTDEPVDKKLVYIVFREHCYDDEDNPSDRWLNLPRLSQKALDDKTKERRYVFA